MWAEEDTTSRLMDGAADLYGAIARMIGDAFFELDPAHRRIRWSVDAAHILLGYDAGATDLQWDDLLELVAPEDREKLEGALASLLEGARIKVDVRLRGNNGEYVWVQMVGGSVSSEGKDTPRIAGVVRNTHDWHNALVSLHEARRMETVGNMASGIAHEFNNHLTPIRGYIELAREHLSAEHPLAEGLDAALERVRYCSELVAQIQAYGRKSMLTPELVDVRRLIPPSVRLATSSFPEVSDRIAVHEDWPDELPMVWVDRGQLQQALLHLFRNAIEAMPEGGTLTVHAEQVFASGDHYSEAPQNGTDDGFMCIRVADTGKGISPEHRARIFEPFFTTRDRSAARGMGLPMVQGMVAQHGGWMEIKTDVGKGTTVAMFLPVADPSKYAQAPKADADGTMAVDAAASPARMLIADDEPFIRRLIKKVFQPEGWQIDEAKDNDEVLERVRGEDYALIVLDLTMPGASTEETIRHLSTANPNARILFISGYTRDERIERLLEMTPSDFINKPFSPRELLSRVDKLIR